MQDDQLAKEGCVVFYFTFSLIIVSQNKVEQVIA